MAIAPDAGAGRYHPRVTESESTRGARKQTVACLVVLFLLIATPFSGALVGDRCMLAFDTRLPISPPFHVAAPEDVLERPANFVTSDINGYVAPQALELQRELRAGEFPGWNPRSFCGQSFLANSSVPAVYPPNLLLALLDPLRGLVWLTVLHLFLAGALAFAWIVNLGKSRWVGLALAAATSGSAFLMVRFHLPCALFAASWFFGHLLAVDRLLLGVTPRRVALLAAVVGASFLAGFPQFAVIECLADGVWFLARLWSMPVGRRAFTAAAFAGSMALGGALAAVLLLPIAEYRAESVRSEWVDPHALADRALKPFALVAGVLPEFFGNPVDRDRLPAVQQEYLPHRLLLGPDVQENLLENTFWPGGIVLAFALFAIVSLRRESIVHALLLLIAIGLLLAVRWPGLSSLGAAFVAASGGNAKRALILVALPLAALGALGFERALSDERRTRRAAIWMLTAGALLGAFAITLRFLPADRLAQRAGEWVDPMRAFLDYTSDRAIPRAAFLLAAGLLLLPRPLAHVRVPGLIAFLAAELLVFGIHFNPLQERAGQYPTTPAIEVLKSGGQRSVRFGDGTLAAPLLGTWFGYRCFDGAEPMVLTRTAELIESIEPGRFDRTDPRVPAAFEKKESLAHPAFLRGATPLVVTATRLDDVPGCSLLHGDEAERLGIYRQSLALPRFRLVAGFEVGGAEIGDERKARLLGPLESGGVDPRRAVVLDERPHTAVAEGPADPPGGEVALVRETNSSLEVAVHDLDRPAFLVIADTFAHGWIARVNGAERPVLAADHAFRAVELSPGDSSVVLEYRPPGLFLGALFSGLALVTLIGLAFLRLTPRRGATGAS